MTIPSPDPGRLLDCPMMSDGATGGDSSLPGRKCGPLCPTCPPYHSQQKGSPLFGDVALLQWTPARCTQCQEQKQQQTPPRCPKRFSQRGERSWAGGQSLKRAERKRRGHHVKSQVTDRGWHQGQNSASLRPSGRTACGAVKIGDCEWVEQCRDESRGEETRKRTSSRGDQR